MREKACGIYSIKNLENGKEYIGKDSRIHWKSRFSTHVSQLRRNIHHNEHLQNAWNKYGEENFEYSIIEICSQDDLSEKEMFYIKSRKSKSPNGYNLTDGGDGSTNPSEETRRRMSESAKRKVVSEETRNKVSESKKGNKNWLNKTHSDESKKKISESHKGKTHSEESKQKISKANKGRVLSDENKEKISESLMGNKYNLGKKRKNSPSQYFGVYAYKNSSKNIWMALITINKKHIYLGYFPTEIEAARVYDKYVIENNLKDYPLNFK